MKITGKRAIKLLGAVAGTIAFSRIACSFLESLAVVRAERRDDAELLQLCSEGLAASSHKMRAACLAAQSSRASPVVLKAVLHAVNSSWQDFTAAVSSPAQLISLLAFVVASLLLHVF